MKQIPRISEAEWEVLGVLWKRAPLTANEVFESFQERTWKLSTVRTFLARLEKKGVVKSHNQDNAKTYSAVIGREECVGQISQSFLDRVFEGATAALLVHFVKSKKLSDGELAELQAILAQKRKGE